MIPQGHPTGGGHERRDADVLGIGMVAALVLLGVGVCLLVSGGALHFFNRERAAQEKQSPYPEERAREFRQPGLIVRSGDELKKERFRERAALTSYQWVDRAGGIARIPVDRAMQIIVEQGLPEVGAGQSRQHLLQNRAQDKDLPSASPEAAP